MNKNEIAKIKRLVFNAIGCEIDVRVDKANIRQGLLIWFADYTKQGGPQFHIRPSGLKRHKVTFQFGAYSKDCLNHILNRAMEEHYTVARALLKNLKSRYSLSLTPAQSIDDWVICSDFKIEITVSNIQDIHDSKEISNTVTEILIPIMASIAELIGYEEHCNITGFENEAEGSLIELKIRRRERNPRNRLLCLSVHDAKCSVCEFDPTSIYGEENGDILEVHHIEPLCEADGPRIYDPLKDLLPLCPNCHRAIHKRKPAYLPHELKEQLHR